MTTTKNSKTTAPLAHRIPAEVSPVITAYAEWLTEQTGYKVDPMSVYIGSQLRSTFQKSPANQKRIADAAKDRAARDAAKAARKAERAAVAKAKAQDTADKVAPVKVSRKAQDKINAVMPKPTAKRAPRRPAVKAASTVAAADGVVIAEQQHIEAVSE